MLVERYGRGRADARPSRVGNPHRAVKLQGAAGRRGVEGSSCPIAFARQRAFCTAPMVQNRAPRREGDAARVNVNETSCVRQRSMRSTPRARSAWRLAMLSASPVRVVATQLTHWPPCKTAERERGSLVVMP